MMDKRKERKWWDEEYRENESDMRKRDNYVSIKRIKNYPIVDLGCGDGINLRPVLDETTKVIGIDFSSEALKRAKKELGCDGELRCNADFILADIEVLPLRRAAYNVTIIDTIENLENGGEKTIAEIGRVSDVSSVININFISSSLIHWLNQNYKTGLKYYNGLARSDKLGAEMSVYGREDAIRKIEELGFELLDITTSAYVYSKEDIEDYIPTIKIGEPTPEISVEKYFLIGIKRANKN